MLHLEEVKSYLETYSANKQQWMDEDAQITSLGFGMSHSEDVVIVSSIREKQVTQLSETLGCGKKRGSKGKLDAFVIESNKKFEQIKLQTSAETMLREMCCNMTIF